MADAKIQPVRTRLAEIVGRRSVIDLGCGKGEEVSALYKPAQYMGVDCSEELILLSRVKNPGYHFYTYSILEMQRRYFEVGILKSVLEHLPPLEAVEVYEHARTITTDILLVAWHTEPGAHLITKHYKGELDTPMLQCRHKRDLFGGVQRREVCGDHVIWEVL